MYIGKQTEPTHFCICTHLSIYLSIFLILSPYCLVSLGSQHKSIYIYVYLILYASPRIYFRLSIHPRRTHTTYNPLQNPHFSLFYSLYFYLPRVLSTSFYPKFSPLFLSLYMYIVYIQPSKLASVFNLPCTQCARHRLILHLNLVNLSELAMSCMGMVCLIFVPHNSIDIYIYCCRWI